MGSTAVAMRKDLVDLIARCRILVVGDAMLDRYWSGSVDRISPEAPVPVVRINEITERAGGAGNVAANISSMGAQSRLLSVVGDDDSGRRLAEILGRSGVDRHLHIDPDTRTTEKLRVVSVNQQLIRLDFESRPEAGILKRVLGDYEELLADSSAVVISDYDKGGLSNITEMIELAQGKGIPVVVDPKGADFSCYRGATVITPNTAEFYSVVGHCTTSTEFSDKAHSLVKGLDIQGLIVTRGPEGMSMFLDSGQQVNQSADAKEVYDVSGAGDTVVAATAVFLASGMEWTEIVKYANAAAGIVIGKFGTATVTLDELDSVVEGCSG